MVSVEGVVCKVGGLLEAPVTGRMGVCWNVQLEEKGVDQLSWTFLDEGGELLAFDVVEDGLAVRVEKDALVQPPAFDHDETVPALRLGPRHRDLLAAVQVEPSRAEHWQYRFQELVLAEGEAVRIHGRVSVRVDPGGQRESPRGQPILRVVRGTEDEPILITRLAKTR